MLNINEYLRIVKEDGGIVVTTTNLNIRTDKGIKEQADKIFSELGLNMTTAINMFLRTTIRENGIPFSLKLEVPNDTTIAAIEEGRRITSDPSVKGYRNMEDLKAALDL
ncbi:addiction module antitoxin, RelB/DinJ family [Gardnerella vaginalis JCP8151B]|nr:addiction module antitoxin, RelB/DinJ family [Gardnerella vaginalis JCP8151B]